MSDWEKSIFIGCTHCDLVDEDAVKVVKNFLGDWKPKYRVHLGDLWDFAALRRGASAEDKMTPFKPDFQAGLDLLDWFKPQYLTLGNHDHRIWRTAEETADETKAGLAREFCGQIEDELRKRRIQWTQWSVHNYLQLPMGGPKFIHGYRSTMYPAKAHFENWGECITAHVHKPDSYSARHIDGGKAFCIGTLADIRKLSYADAHAAKLGWRNSFLYGIHHKRTGKWQAWEIIKENGHWISPQGVLC